MELIHGKSPEKIEAIMPQEQDRLIWWWSNSLRSSIDQLESVAQAQAGKQCFFIIISQNSLHLCYWMCTHLQSV